MPPGRRNAAIVGVVGVAVMVKVIALLVPPGVVTVTVRTPAAAFASTANVAVIDVALVTATLLMATPVPLTVIVAAEVKFAPVSVTATLDPAAPAAGPMLESVGVAAADGAVGAAGCPEQALMIAVSARKSRVARQCERFVIIGLTNL